MPGPENALWPSDRSPVTRYSWPTAWLRHLVAYLARHLESFEFSTVRVHLAPDGFVE